MLGAGVADAFYLQFVAHQYEEFDHGRMNNPYRYGHAFAAISEATGE